MKKSIFCLLGICMLLLPILTKAQTSVGSGLNCFISSKKNVKSTDNLFAERFCVYEKQGKEYISLIMRVDAKSDLKFLSKYDCEVGSRNGRIVTLRINVNQVEKLIMEKEIIEVETARKAGAINMKDARYELQVQDIEQGNDLLQAYTGKDVIIGVADWGIDFTHPDFYDTLMDEYRIIAAWDQFRNAGPAPEGFSYGTLLEGKDQLLAAGCDTVNQYDTGYHATHVAGITGGGGAGTKYKGIATEAQWLFCTWRVDEASFMDGCTWMRNVAKSQKKRLVINNSWGVYLFGYMDGSSMLDEFINTMSDNDSVVFVVSAGNNGDAYFHIAADFDQHKGDTLRTEIQFNLPTPASKNYWGEMITLQSEKDTKFSSKLEFYDYTWKKIGETPLMVSNTEPVSEDFIITDGGDSMIYRGSTRFPSDNRALVDWEVRVSKYINFNDHVVLAVTADEGVVHGWNLACLTTGVGNWGLSFVQSQDGYLAGEYSHGVSEPGLAEKAITVAAHQYKKNGSWPGKIASFSSRGPNLTSYYKPEISAPGFHIISAFSSFATEKETTTITVPFNEKEYSFVPLNGTSMSGPMVSGAIALMLQANPHLSSAEVKDILLKTAMTDDYTGECPNDTWGYGKINAYKAVKMAEQKLGMSDATVNSLLVYPNPAENYLNIEGLNQGDDVYITDMVARRIQTPVLHGNTLDIRDLKSGVYLLNINNNGKIQKIKFVKI